MGLFNLVIIKRYGNHLSARGRLCKYSIRTHKLQVITHGEIKSLAPPFYRSAIKDTFLFVKYT